MRMLKIGLLLLLATVALTGCATKMDRNSELDKAQYAYSAAIRWGDFEGAWNLVDPKYKQAHPMTDLELERYKQIQISGYRDLAAQVGDGVAMREIGIGVINRNTLVERQTRYTERWRYDLEHKTWWLTVGLPDLWQGE
ncbi:MAG TPA: hypothetical protein VHF02_10105 [Luteimonas sp.]|nr:hypothetical protein [Luteimonas sp.]